MTNFEELNFIKFKQNNSNVQIDCFHNVPIGELFIEEITIKICDKSNCSSILAKYPRNKIDLNRPIDNTNKEAILEYRNTIYTILKSNNFLDENNKLNEPYLNIIIHGMKNRPNKEIEIGTRLGKLCELKICEWFITTLKNKLPQFRIVTDEEFLGNEVLEHNKFGDEYSKGLGKNFNIFQIEINRTLREKHKNLIVDVFCEMVDEFNQIFVEQKLEIRREK